jgi:hypothetical protein
LRSADFSRFASEGLRFTQFYVNSPICSPSRVAITTGQYPQRWLCDAYDGKPPKKHDLGSSKLGQGPITCQDRSVITTSFVDAALSFIDRVAATGKLFFVNVWPDDVHSPFFPPQAKRNSKIILD